MEDPEAEEPVEQLLREAEKAGYRPSRSQLHSWQQKGLLPTPRQRGLGRSRGTAVLYPPRSARQAAALCKHRGTKRRSLKAVSWDLWWEGYPLSGEAEEWIRGFFRAEMEFLEEPAAEGFTERDDFLDVLDKLVRVRLSHPLVSRIRRRTGRVNFPTLFKFLLETTTGTPPEFRDEDDAKIVAKGLGFANPKDAEPVLRLIAPVLDPRKLRAVFDGASMEELGRARDEIRETLQLIDAVNALVAAVMGRALDPQLTQTLTQPSHRGGPGLVLSWLSMTSLPGARSVFEAVTSTVRAVIKGELTLAEALQALENIFTSGVGNQIPEDSSNA